MVGRTSAFDAAKKLAAGFKAHRVARRRPEQKQNGRSVFDCFAKTDSLAPAGKRMERLAADGMLELTDLIHGPVALLLHSAVAPSGWLVADARAKLVKSILAAEPVRPPIVNAVRGAACPGRDWARRR
jgi:hypothetical protein